MTVQRWIRWLEARFEEEGTQERAEKARAYMKSTLRFHGVTQPVLRKASAEFLRQHALSGEELRTLVRALYETDGFDLRSAAIALLERRVKELGPRDLPLLLELVRLSGCWAHVDWIAVKLAGPAIALDPKYASKLRRWANDPDLWVRRTALLAQLDALRAGQGDFELFTELALPMLEEKEFFIRKAIGWVLREVSKKRPALVRAFVREHGDRMSGLTRREASKYL